MATQHGEETIITKIALQAHKSALQVKSWDSKFVSYNLSYLFRTDLVEVCRHLGYDDDYADDMLNQIGQDGFISYDAFAQSNLALLAADVCLPFIVYTFSLNCHFSSHNLCFP